MKVLLSFVLLSLAGFANAANEIDAKVEAAVAAESRPAGDMAPISKSSRT